TPSLRRQGGVGCRPPREPRTPSRGPLSRSASPSSRPGLRPNAELLKCPGEIE
ncbi:hypothetical protein P7K49_024603, partial [Saguinus oedipus]